MGDMPNGPYGKFQMADDEGGCNLTPAQREVIELVTQGLTNAEIAERLDKAPGTVKRQIADILRRLDAHSRAEAAVIWVRSELGMTPYATGRARSSAGRHMSRTGH